MGHNHEGGNEDNDLLETQVVTITLDDDEEIECSIITTFEVNSKEYIVLLPLDENGENEDGDVWIYRFIRDTTGGNNHDLENIEDDDEYEDGGFDNYSSDQENPTYDRYNGSYAQDEMGYSDDDIDTIFDGDPDAYWNID